MGAQLAQQAFSRGSSTDWERREAPFGVDARANEFQFAGAIRPLRQQRDSPRLAYR